MTIDNPTLETTTSISLTEPAANRVRQLLDERNLPDHALRIFISGGGCSGFQYGLAIEGEPREDDLRFSYENVNLVVDPQSYGYLGGATIDYVDDLMGGGFRIENPNAVSSCGCGHSFRTEGSESPHEGHGAAGCC